MNLSQKYRIQTLDNIVGHTTVLKDLNKRVQSKDFPQTIMFSGSSGTGKTTIARIISKHLLCENGNCCNTCKVCVAIDNELPLPNYYEYNASNLNIEAMRKIEEIACKSDPFSKSSVKVFYIDEMQELNKNKSAMKNILKILEKPMKDTYFILGTMDISKIDAAIKRRAVVYRLSSISSDDIFNYMSKILEKEGCKIESEEHANTVGAIAESCNGSVGIVLPILDRFINSEIKTEEHLIAELGIATSNTLIQIINSIFSGSVDIDITEDMVQPIILKLNLFIQHTLGKELNKWEKMQITGIRSNLSIENLIAVIQNFLSLYEYTYLNNTIINSHILKSVWIGKSNNRPQRQMRG